MITTEKRFTNAVHVQIFMRLIKFLKKKNCHEIPDTCSGSVSASDMYIIVLKSQIIKNGITIRAGRKIQ